ncbi:DUF4870 domain-containing protein [Sporosarcina sp. NPDC096371]|uniref:DUF4870 domain-containing protein n=1 Tax=Sporosarcina sp. NPDC096371 TaxID=3364530 RepID=UPI003829A2F2
MKGGTGTTEQEKKGLPDELASNTSPEPEETSKKSTIGLDENIGGMLCYIFIVCLVFMFMEKENRFIRFHALQAVFLGVFLIVFGLVLGVIPIIGWILSLFMGPLVLVMVVFMMYQAYQGKYYKLPVIGDMAEKQLE